MDASVNTGSGAAPILPPSGRPGAPIDPAAALVPPAAHGEAAAAQPESDVVDPKATTVALPPTAIAAQATGPGPVITLPPGPDGGDPLVRAYLERFQVLCAYHTLSWLWIWAGVVAAIAGAMIGDWRGGEPLTQPWSESLRVLRFHALLGNTYGAIAGVACGGAIAGLLGLMANQRRVSLRIPGGIIGLAALGWLAQVLSLQAILDPSCIALVAATALGFLPQVQRRLGLFLVPLLAAPVLLMWAAYRAPASSHAIAALAGAAALGMAMAASRTRVPAGQEPLLSAAFAGMIYLAIIDWTIFISVVTGVLCVVYFVTIGFRLLALACGGNRGLRAAETPEPPGGWPMYTVLVPLYKERNVARNILANLANLDYPRERLDVKFLLEADDPETLPALLAAGIPSWAEVVVVPPGQPKTKPRACNHGLERARGDFLVIFDAEDRPEPDQLKQAVLAFAAVEPRVICLQAQLAYHNHAQNLLTRWFALEYNVWFRQYLSGLERMRVPIPLGGTSNHFRTAALRGLGGWDPFNVTEDCDLGVRLRIAGHRTRMLDSTTWEEATSRVGNWIRQRSRWLKGYLITHLVWFRRPLHLLMGLGPWGALGFVLSVFCVSALAVVNLALWLLGGYQLVLYGIDMAHGHALWDLLTTRSTAHDRLSQPMIFSGPGEDHFWSALSQAFAVVTLCLLLGNLAFILINGLAGRRPGQKGLWGAALLSPLYWVLISIAALKGAWQLLFKPHYWEKTVHGFDAGHEPPAATPEAPVAQPTPAA